MVTDPVMRVSHDIVRDYWRRYWTDKQPDSELSRVLGNSGARWRRSRHRAAAKSVTLVADLTDWIKRERRRRCRAARGQERKIGVWNRFPARSDDLRRPLGKQRLAPGIAQAAHEADLEQRRAGQPDHGRAIGSVGHAQRPWRRAWRIDGRCGRGRICRPEARSAASGSCPAIPTARSRSRWVMAARGPGTVGTGFGIQCLAAPHVDGPLVRPAG